MLTREFDDCTLSKANAHEAAKKVTEAFASWRSNGYPGNRPRFGNGDYLRLRGDQLIIEPNDRGFGAKLSLVPYHPEWFHLRIGDYQREYLQAVVDGEATTGSAEVHLRDDGTANLHLTVKTDVRVYKPGDLSRWVGVDLGENVLYAAAVVHSDGTVAAVDMESGRESRHYRDRLSRKRAELQSKGDLRGVKKCLNEHERYTDHILNVASRRIVDLAADHAPCGIRAEKLTGYRDTADDPIHDWPYAAFQEKIAYKATAAGIPVVFVDPAGTSTTCRKCGQTDPEYRSGTEFACRRCGYEVHADVNAAINIARRGSAPAD
ncbi:RNA-guided endonuclease InsQ/TnpB family protein [Halegenticoccus tardaugens]|uniref:RNA-guided endonuclease InsQ/TnpB family protein n=1 Tax=Halegenticoccus tardaugens TaxID=2071624 RepID=UPI001E325972|nr:transposase [Halegenticoccus tardaugens]